MLSTKQIAQPAHFLSSYKIILSYASTMLKHMVASSIQPAIICSSRKHYHPVILEYGEKVSSKHLRKYPQIVIKSTLPNEQSFGVDTSAVHWSVTDTFTKANMIGSGLGWGRLPSHIVDEDIQHAAALKPGLPKGGSLGELMIAPSLMWEH